jgi:hypothetical protein
MIAFHYAREYKIAFHYARECEALDIAECNKILIDFDLSDAFLKALDNNTFSRHYGFIFGWPTTRLKKNQKVEARRRKKKVI